MTTTHTNEDYYALQKRIGELEAMLTECRAERLLLRQDSIELTSFKANWADLERECDTLRTQLTEARQQIADMVPQSWGGLPLLSNVVNKEENP